MTVVIVTIIYALFAVLEIISLKKTKQKKELVTYCTILSAAYIISMLIVFDVQIPSINRMVGDLIMPLVKE